MIRPVRNKYHRSLFLSALFTLALAASVTAGCGKKPAEQPTVPAESSAADMNKIISDIAQDPEFKEAVSKAASNAHTDPALRKAVSEAAEDPEVSRAVSEAVSEALSEAIQEGLSKAVPDDPAVRQVLREFDVQDAWVSAVDKGALDFAIRARMQCAICRAAEIQYDWGKEDGYGK